MPPFFCRSVGGFPLPTRPPPAEAPCGPTLLFHQHMAHPQLFPFWVLGLSATHSCSVLPSNNPKLRRIPLPRGHLAGHTCFLQETHPLTGCPPALDTCLFLLMVSLAPAAKSKIFVAFHQLIVGCDFLDVRLCPCEQ